jgi:probable phosphoglycerate mutase
MNLIIIRNTEAPSNVHFVVGGRCNESLTEKGVKQAEELAKQLKTNINYDVIFSSPVNRALETANIINHKGLPIQVDERITERDPGNLLLKSRDLVNKSEWNSLDMLKTKDGSETLLSLLTRVKAFIEDLKKKYPDKTIVVVTHNSISRAFWLLNSIEKKSIEEINFYYQSSEKIQIYEDYVEREGLY